MVRNRLPFALLACCLPACEKPTPSAPTGKIEFLSPASPAEQTYSTRARITGLPAAGSMYLQAHHETIPDFVGRSGSVTGMPEMIMEFPALRKGIDLSPFSVGDAVRITFEVRWKSDPRTLVTSIQVLPSGESPHLSDEPPPG